MQSKTQVSRIAILGSYSPRRCGIATFTTDLASALKNTRQGMTVDPVAMTSQACDYPAEVLFDIPEDSQIAYSFAADMLNDRAYEVLSVQHEYGIYGGDSGAYLLNLVRAAKMPVVTTLHTVLRKPTQSQRLVLEELMQLSARIVVMSRTAIDLLSTVHDVDSSKVDFIPHGIPVIPELAGSKARAELGGAGPLLLTFGLLSHDKGIQNVIKALPSLLKRCPGAKYLVVGATHPQVLASTGETYRQSLIQLAQDLGVEDSVVFVDEFVSLERLCAYLSATDFYITPYLNPMQITSGTLAYSMGAGKVVISTPYEYAKEVLADGRGVLVGFGDAEAIANAVAESWTTPVDLQAMGQRAAAYGQDMYWARVGELYLASFERAIGEARRLPKPVMPARLQPLPTASTEHLERLTDDTGIFQHATFSVPNRAEGYCTDDNARALLLTIQLEASGKLLPKMEELQTRYLSFVADSFNAETGRFRNFMSFQREWLEDAGSEDSQGRALWAIGEAAAGCRNAGHVEYASKLFDRAAGAFFEMNSPRTWAYAILGATACLKAFPSSRTAKELVQHLAARLAALHSANSTPAWPWIESRLAYANARIPQAMMVAGLAVGDRELISSGLSALDWLMDGQTAPSGCFSPVGSRGAGPNDFGQVQFDQQPVEVWSSVSACITASKLEAKERHLNQAMWCFDWFLGGNVHGFPVASPRQGSCADGLHATGLNLNQGAESTLSYLCALTELRQASCSLDSASLKSELL